MSSQVSATAALANYRKAMDKGLLKVLSKMGISLLTSYHGSQIFEGENIQNIPAFFWLIFLSNQRWVCRMR